MRYRPTRQFVRIGFLVLMSLATSTVEASLTVHSGWDLFFTAPDSRDYATGTYWQGVPLGTYDFGGAIGVKDVGYTDTIIHRTQDAVAPSYGSWVNGVPVSIDKLQLQSTTQTNLGAGLGWYYVTLQSERGGPASGGTMDIYFDTEGDPHGVWQSTMTLNFDIRYGSLTGPVVFSATDTITAGYSSGGTVAWRHEANGDELLIPGVNYLLDGANIEQDFWPGELVPGIPGTPCETHHVYRFDEGGIIVYHDVRSVCPEPGAWALVISGAAVGGLGLLRRKLRA
jgi:hypothetical protein